MTVETFLGIAGIVLIVAFQLVCKWHRENTYLKYKDQPVGKTKGGLNNG